MRNLFKLYSTIKTEIKIHYKMPIVDIIEKSTFRTNLENVIAGTFGGNYPIIIEGICGVLVGHPFDTIKVRLQTNDSYKTSFQTFTRIVREENVNFII